LNRPLAALAQERQDRKACFFGPPGQQKHAVLSVLGVLRGSSVF